MVREFIATAMRETADQVCRDHYHSISQEAQITSRIAQALESSMQQYEFLGNRVEIVVQDLPDRGPRSLESRLGADLYVGIRVVRDGRLEMSKGLFAQSKLGTHLSKDGRSKLVDQCEKMRKRSPASYVWVYTPDGVRVITVQDVVRRDSRNLLGGRRLDEAFSETFACHEGDPGIKLPDVQPDALPLRTAVGLMLERMDAPNGFAARTLIGMDLISQPDEVQS